MKSPFFIWSLLLSLWITAPCLSQGRQSVLQFDFYGDTMTIPDDSWTHASFGNNLTETAIDSFYHDVIKGNYKPVVSMLLAYKDQKHLNDWFFYQLIRKTAQQISPKADNYERYTLYKWFLLAKCGYDANLSIRGKELLFYVKSSDNIYDIPYYTKDNNQYVCLNYHDYGKTDLDTDNETQAVRIVIPEAKKAFSYRVTQMPEFTASDYAEKRIQFQYGNKSYHFEVKVNPEVQNIFANYPVVDYEAYFNIPLSNETYNSLLPKLREAVAGMKQKKGVDYLMRFTRNAFLFENDQEHFGKEKRLSPEQTLLYNYSDCDDRAALFFYLVKEIYNVPMIVIAYPTHVTVAVKFDKPTGKFIRYKDSEYSVCEPTPQAEDLKVGHISSHLKHMPYQVAYEYNPGR